MSNRSKRSSRPQRSGSIQLCKDHKNLVPIPSILVTVLEPFAIVTSVELAITQLRAVILGGVLVGAIVRVIPMSVPLAVVAALLNAFVVAGIQGCLSQLERPAVAAIAIPIAATMSSVVVAITVSISVTVGAIAITAPAVRPGILSVITVFK